MVQNYYWLCTCAFLMDIYHYNVSNVIPLIIAEQRTEEVMVISDVTVT